jgi:Na+/H+ antiporter NhaD/arsenite permease-like protein
MDLQKILATLITLSIIFYLSGLFFYIKNKITNKVNNTPLVLVSLAVLMLFLICATSLYPRG